MCHTSPVARFNLERALESQTKALGPHPAFMDRLTPVSTYAPGGGSTSSLLSQREATRHSDAFGGSQAIDWVYDCIGLYTDAAATADYRLEKPDGTKMVRAKTDGTPPDYEVGPKQLYDLLDKPNPFFLYDELISLLVIDLLLVGNGYWYKWRNNERGRPLALYRLAPSHVKIKPGPYGPVQYEYQPPGAKQKLKINPDDIIHFRRPNPHSPYYGMGVIQGAGRAMDLELAITDTMASYFENRADPSLIVQSERRIPIDVMKKLNAQMRGRLSGSRRAGELLVLQNGLKATSLSTSASDALFDKLSTMSRDRVLAKFRASPMLFGVLDESSGSNKVSDVRREFDNATLRPFLSKLSVNITAALTSAWGVNFVIEHRSVLPADEAIKVGESVAKIPGVKIREIRKQYEQFGIPESTGDTEIDELVINLPGENMDETGDGVNGGDGLADQPLSGEAGRPPLPENTAAFGVANNGTPGGAVVQTKSLEDMLAALEQKALNSAGERVTVGNRLEDERRPDDSFAVARQADVTAAARYIEDGLRDAATALERALLDHVDGKALKTSDLVSRVKRSEAWTTFRKAIESVLEEGGRRAASSGVIHSGLTPDEDVDYDEVVQTVMHRPDGVRGILNTLRDRVVSKLKDARENDAERHELNAIVQETVEAWRSSQAQTVAETEAVHAYNEATLTAAELSGITHVYVTDGDDHDEPCVKANGEVWEISHARQNRLEHPRCRRAFLPLTAAQVS